MESIVGTLLTNKTYGRDKKGRVLYLCITDTHMDKPFLVPFTNPVDKAFNKTPTNYYVVFSPLCNTTLHGHPVGQLMDCLGSVDDWAAYSKYELFKRNLYGTGFKIFDQGVARLKAVAKGNSEGVADRQGIASGLANYPVISIDPQGCTDIDDAFCFFISDNKAHLQIHIANVPAYIEENNLWNFITDRATTVYMPTCKVPMLPKQLSENACSLLEGTIKPTFMIEYVFSYNPETRTIEKLLEIHSPIATVAHIQKNYTYEDTIDNQSLLFDAARLMEPSQIVNNTHDLIAVFMMAFNKACVPMVPIYRNCFSSSSSSSSDAAFNYGLQTFTASYSTSCEGHATFEGARYTHITSPIRRLVDLINMTAILYGTAHPFVQTWLTRIEHINNYCKQARKAQQNAELYKLLSTSDVDPIYEGIYIEGTDVVYLIELRLFVCVGKNQVLPEGRSWYRIYMFHKEHTLKRKIRIMPLQNNDNTCLF
jgi:hypothetical protein